MPNNFSFAVPKDFWEALTCLKYLSYRLFITTEMNYSSIIIEKNLVRLSNLIEIFLAGIAIETSLDVLIAVSSVISNVSKILTINIESIRIVRVYLAKRVPVHVDFLRSFIGFLSQIIQNIKVWNDCSEVGPKFYLKIANFFNGTLHLSK